MSDEIPYYPIKKILLPTDGSSYAINASRYAAKIAKKNNSKVTILHVMNLHLSETGEPVEVYDIESAVIEINKETEIKERAKNIIEKTKKYLIEENILFDTEYYIYRNIPDIIVKAANEKNFDLIIMGHKGISGLRHTLLGSVAERVCQMAPCPVLVIR
jgi:nucleotide-binding universal stress UspA family protein